VPKLAGRWAWSQASSGSKGSKGSKGLPEARTNALVPMEPLKFMNRLEKEAYFRRHQHHSERNQASKVIAYKKSPAQTPKFLFSGDHEEGEEGMERSLASVAVGKEESSSTGSGNGLEAWSKGWRKMMSKLAPVLQYSVAACALGAACAVGVGAVAWHLLSKSETNDKPGHGGADCMSRGHRPVAPRLEGRPVSVHSARHLRQQALVRTRPRLVEGRSGYQCHVEIGT